MDVQNPFSDEAAELPDPLEMPAIAEGVMTAELFPYRVAVARDDSLCNARKPSR